MIQEITAVKRSTRAYINFARDAFPQEFGHTAQVVLTQVPVIQQARLLKLSTPPILFKILHNFPKSGAFNFYS